MVHAGVVDLLGAGPHAQTLNFQGAGSMKMTNGGNLGRGEEVKLCISEGSET